MDRRAEDPDVQRGDGPIESGRIDAVAIVEDESVGELLREDLPELLQGPLFGQIKGARGFRRFSFRGLGKVQAEWQLICLTHNLLKPCRAGWRPQAA